MTAFISKFLLVQVSCYKLHVMSFEGSMRPAGRV